MKGNHTRSHASSFHSPDMQTRKHSAVRPAMEQPSNRGRIASGISRRGTDTSNDASDKQKIARKTMRMSMRTNTMNSSRELVLKTGALPPDFKSWEPLRLRLLLFVSSTFTDTALERNILQEIVVPELRKMARVHGIEINLTDLRWGISDESTKDHRTWLSCYDEILNCHSRSLGKFFLSLQSDKYGYTPIPRMIPRKLFETCLEQSKNEKSNNLAREWYHLDQNSISSDTDTQGQGDEGEYVLRSLESLCDQNFWGEVRPKLAELLKDVPFWRLNERILVGRSVSEYEWLEAERLGIENCGWIKREITGDLATRDPHCFYNDERGNKSVQFLHQNLIAHMASAFRVDPRHPSGAQGNVRNIKVDIDDLVLRQSPDGKLVGYCDVGREEYLAAEITDNTKEYLRQFKELAHDLLSEEVEHCIEVSDRWIEDGEGLGIKGSVLSELLHHAVMSRDKLKCFCEKTREKQLSAAMRVIAEYEQSMQARGENGGDAPSPPHSTGHLRAVTLAIIGKSGSGKTALCAKLSQVLLEREMENEKKKEGTHPVRPVLVRYCATSPDSATGKQIVQSLCRQIHFILGNSNTASGQELPDRYDALVAHFHRLLREKPYIILIDSLDQLSNEDEARSNLTFLRDMEARHPLHPRTLIIVSSLPDDGDYLFGCASRLHESRVPVVEVPIDESHSASILSHQLAVNHKRRLTEAQTHIALHAAKAEPTPLYFNLASRIAATWNSYTPVEECILRSGVRPIILQIFERMRKEFQPVFTNTALALMTLSVHGLTSTEMEDLLSIDSEVLEEVFEYSRPNIERIPVHVWLRLRNHIGGLTVERAEGCLKWYHRQLSETAEHCFSTLDGGKYARRAYLLLSRYFSDTVSDAYVQDRKITQQKLLLWGESVWFLPSKVNARRVLEGSSALAKYASVLAGMVTEDDYRNGEESPALTAVYEATEKAVGFLCDLDTVCAFFRVNEGGRLPLLLDQVAEVAYKISQALVVIANPDNEAGFKPKQGSLAARFRDLLTTLKDYWRWTLKASGRLAGATEASIPSLVTLTATELPPGSRVRADLRTVLDRYPATGTVFDLKSSHSHSEATTGAGAAAVSGGEIVSPRALLTHRRAVWLRACSLSMAEEDDELLVRMVGHGHKEITAVCLTHDSCEAVSACVDGTISIWDLRSAECTGTLSGHEGVVTTVTTGPTSDPFDIVSGGKDSTLRLWDRRSGVCRLKIEVACPVRAVAMTSNNELQVSIGLAGLLICAGDDGKVYTYRQGDDDEERGICRPHSTLAAHTGAVNALDVTKDGSLLASASDDNTAILWNLGMGTSLLKFTNHKSSVTCCKITSDIKYMATGSLDKTVKVYSIQNAMLLAQSPRVDEDAGLLEDRQGIGKLKMNLDHHETKPIRSIAISDNAEKIVAGSDERTIHVWEARSDHTMLNSLEGHTKQVTSVFMHPNGDFLVSGSRDSSVCVWDVEQEDESLVRSQAAVGRYRAAKKEERGHKSDITAVAVTSHLGNNTGADGGASGDTSPDAGMVISASRDRTVKFWARDRGGSYRGEIKMGGALSVLCLAVSPDNSRLYAGANDNSCSVWTLSPLHEASGTGEAVDLMHDQHCLHMLMGHTQWVMAIKIATDSSVVATGSDDCTMRVYSYEAGTFLFALNAHEGHVHALDILIPPHCEEGEAGAGAGNSTSAAISASTPLLISGGYDRAIHFWHLPSIAPSDGVKPTHSLLQAHHNRIVGIVITTSTGTGTDTQAQAQAQAQVVVSACADGNIKILSLTAETLFEFAVAKSGPRDEVRTVLGVTPNPALVLSGNGNGNGNGYNGQAGPCLMVLESARFIILDLESRSIVHTSQSQSGRIHAAALDKDGRRIITGDESNVRIWEIATTDVLAN